MMPLAVVTWRVIFGCANRMLSNMTLLTKAFYHRFTKKANGHQQIRHVVVSEELGLPDS